MSQHDGQARHAFAADNTDLDARLARAVGHDRREAGFDEVDLLDALLALLERLARRKINGFQVRFEQREIFARKARQDAVRRQGTSFGAATRELPEADGLVDAGRDVPSGRSILRCAARLMIDPWKAGLNERGEPGAAPQRDRKSVV